MEKFWKRFLKVWKAQEQELIESIANQKEFDSYEFMFLLWAIIIKCNNNMMTETGNRAYLEKTLKWLHVSFRIQCDNPSSFL